MVDVTYVTISSYKYTSKLPHFLTPSHILTLLLTISPYESLSFFSLYFGVFSSFLSLYLGVKRGQSWGKKMIGEQLSWDKTKQI